jgi:hypothetical protein
MEKAARPRDDVPRALSDKRLFDKYANALSQRDIFAAQTSF